MDREWNDSQPIYRQLRDRVVAMILDGVLKEGDPLPSVRNVAAEYRVNPLTVLKGYQNWSTKSWWKANEGWACSSRRARAICCCRANARDFLRRMAPDLRHHSAARPEAGGIAEWRRERRSSKPKARAERRSAEFMACIEARGLRKAFGATVALDGVICVSKRAAFSD